MKFQIEIENYENLTPEEKIAALEANYESVAKHKATADKNASEAASYKKQLRDKMSEEEAKAAAEAEEKAKLMARLEQLELEKAVTGYTASYLAMGYDEKLAKSSAEALAKGDNETLFKNQKLHAEAREKALRAEILKETPTPPPGKSDGGVTKEDVQKMTLAQKTKFAQDNPETYKEFFGG